jgi:hypothetical protein
LLASRGIACLSAWHSGFRALSDDDYARISIAQRFAHAPHFDPTGSSWLPAPFWFYGAAFRFFGTGLEVARATAIALGLAATVLVYVAARLLGAGGFSALLGAAFSALLVPYSLLLGIAAVPEVPCAALIVCATATLARSEPNLRGLGGLSLIAACWSRYEAWPVALAFALCCAWDAWRVREPAFLVGVALALAGPALWLALGRLEHGEALFFVTRVTAYRRALGGADASVWQRLLEYPRLLLRDAALPCGLLVVALIVGRNRRNNGERLACGRATLTLSSLLAFLILGSIRDGVPTHHAGRVLIPIWYFGTIVLGHLLGRLATHRTESRQVALLACFIALPSATLDMPDQSRAERALELDAGQTARRFTARDLAIDTPDYGFFAVQAAFGSSVGTTVLDEHDPRRVTADPFVTAQTLERMLRERSARFALVTAQHAALLSPRCAPRWRNARFVLAECAARPQ